MLDFTTPGEQRPMPNLRLKVWAGHSFPNGVPLSDTVTDSRGRDTITGVSTTTLFFQTAPGSEYRFLCDGYPVEVRMPITDLPVVHTDWSGNRPPQPWLMGTLHGSPAGGTGWSTSS